MNRRGGSHSSLVLLTACVAITLLHLGGRLLPAGVSGRGIMVSALKSGAALDPAVRTVLGSAGPNGCSMIVSFRPECPFCKHAAALESAAARGGAFSRVIWVAHELTDAMEPFPLLLRDGSEIVVSAEVFAALQVRAVPGLYLVDGAHRLRWVGPYRGDEAESVLADRCARPLPESSP